MTVIGLFGPIGFLLQPLLGASSALVFFYVGIALGVLFVLWFLFSRGRRRQRAYSRAQRLLRRGAWQEALTIAREKQSAGRLSAAWDGRLRNLQGECHRLAGDAAVKEKRYEDGLEHYQTAAGLLNLPEAENRQLIVEAMLEEVRLLFSLNTQADTGAAHALIARILLIQSPCPEASFWQGLCDLRQNRLELAMTALRSAHEGAQGVFLDPALYLGILSLREGSRTEALRYLSEANRIAPSCPFVAWQLGTAILAADGNSQLAARALQRAVNRLTTLRQGAGGQEREQAQAPESDGAPTPARARARSRIWVEGLPQAYSYVRHLAVNHAYTCPVLGNNLVSMLRQAQLSLGQAHYRQGNFQEAADLFGRLLQDSPPTVPVLRGLGQALARLQRYEDAYKHLRAAYDQEEPANAFTAGYLALCGAKGKPTQPEDKLKNVSWAISLLAQFDQRGNEEWAALCSAIHAEARSLGLPAAVADQVRLCDVLASVDASDPSAAAAYEHLAGTVPEALKPEYARLYCRAAQQHGCGGDLDLDLFARTFREAQAARAFYAERGWDFEEVEYIYLQRCSARQPGQFPEAPGPEFPARAERLLLARSRRLEEAGQNDAALASADVLLKLAPRSPAAHDRLAYLCYRRGDLDRAAALLAERHALDPSQPRPLVQRAIIEQRRGNPAAFMDAIAQALERGQNEERAAIAFMGARLALRESVRELESKSAVAGTQPSTPTLPLSHSLTLSRKWLEECLKEDPSHQEAPWCLAAVLSITNDREALAAQAARMPSALGPRPSARGGRFHYLTASCHLAASNYPGVLETSARAAEADASLAIESSYVAGLAHLHMGNETAAVSAFEQVTQSAKGPSVDHARALLGRINFARGAYEDAIKWWQTLDAHKRATWKLDEPLRATVFLTALQALEAGHFEQAANKFRDAGRIGLRDRRLGALLILALVKKGCERVREWESDSARLRSSRTPTPPLSHSPELPLEQAIKAGCRDPNVAYLLALAYKRQGKPREAREALQRIAQPDANILLQQGILSLRDNQQAQAEQEFAAAWEMDPASYPICYNLLRTRLALGQTDAAAALLPGAIELAPTPDEQHGWCLLRSLLQACRDQSGDLQVDPALAEMSPADEQQLLNLLRSLGHLETICTLLGTLVAARPRSTAIKDAYFEARLVQAKLLLDRCDWAAAERLLRPLTREKHTDETTQAAFENLLGCCVCLGQDFEGGVSHFGTARKLVGSDARIQQNLALAHEWQGELAQAEPHWKRYFELLDHRVPSPAGPSNYGERLAYEGHSRLASAFAEKEKWSSALTYAQRAQSLRPNDPDALERLFQLYNQAGRPEEARRALEQLRKVRPSDPTCDLYELDLIDVRNLHGIDRLVTHLEVILKRYPNDGRVEARILAMLANLLPRLERIYEQSAGQLSKVVSRVRHLPNYQIDWAAVHDMTRDLRSEFQKLRRISNKCLALVQDAGQQHTLRDLIDDTDRKMDQCRSLGGSHG